MDYFARAMLEAILAGALAGVVGTLVVLRERAFFTMSLTHATFPGAVLAAMLGIAVPIGAAATAIVLVLVAALIGRMPSQGSAVASGVMLTSGFALGILAQSVAAVPVDVESFLTGSVLATGVGQLWLTGIVLVAVAAALAVLGRQLLFATFDPRGYRAAGRSPLAMEIVSLALIAATVVVLMPVVGAILAVALIVAPAAAARRLVRGVGGMLLVAPAIGIAVSVLGLLASRAWSLSAGGAITLLAAATFGLSLLVRRPATVGAP